MYFFIFNVILVSELGETKWLDGATYAIALALHFTYRYEIWCMQS